MNPLVLGVGATGRQGLDALSLGRGEQPTDVEAARVPLRFSTKAAREPVDEVGEPLELPPGGRDRHYRVRNRSEEHTSELQSRGHLVCRLLLEKKNSSP